MNRDHAADLFLSMILTRARDGVIAGLATQLRDGPPGRKPDQRALARHKRFRALGAEEQDLVMDVASETLKSVLFGVMIILDGLSGGNPIQDTTSDFALELRTYTSDAARTSDQPVASVRINPPSSTRPLHDLLLWRLEEENEEE